MDQEIDQMQMLSDDISHAERDFDLYPNKHIQEKDEFNLSEAKAYVKKETKPYIAKDETALKLWESIQETRTALEKSTRK